MKSKITTSMAQSRLAHALGWFSLGLGLAEIIIPKKLARGVGVKHRPVLFRLLGLRQVASGIGILTGRKPTGWLWSRVAGDAMDLLLLGQAASDGGVRRSRGRVIAATAAMAACAALDTYSGQAMTDKTAEVQTEALARRNRRRLRRAVAVKSA